MQLRRKLFIVGHFISDAPVAGIAFRSQVVHDKRECEGPTHHKRLPELVAQRLHSCVEPISVVDHVEHEIGLSGELNQAVPVGHCTTIKALQDRTANIVEGSVLDA